MNPILKFFEVRTFDWIGSSEKFLEIKRILEEDHGNTVLGYFIVRDEFFLNCHTKHDNYFVCSVDLASINSHYSTIFYPV